MYDSHGDTSYDSDKDLWWVTIRRPFTYVKICEWLEDMIEDDWKGVDHTGWRPGGTGDHPLLLPLNGKHHGFTKFAFSTEESVMAFKLRWL